MSDPHANESAPILLLSAEDLDHLLNAERGEHIRPLPPLEPGTLWFSWVRRVTFMYVDAVMSLHKATTEVLTQWENSVSCHDPYDHLAVRKQYQEVLAGYLTVASLLWAMRPQKNGD